MILQALEVMMYGMLGIFIVIGIIIGMVKLLSILGDKENNIQ